MDVSKITSYGLYQAVYLDDIKREMFKELKTKIDAQREKLNSNAEGIQPQLDAANEMLRLCTEILKEYPELKSDFSIIPDELQGVSNAVRNLLASVPVCAQSPNYKDDYDPRTHSWNDHSLIQLTKQDGTPISLLDLLTNPHVECYLKSRHISSDYYNDYSWLVVNSDLYDADKLKQHSNGEEYKDTKSGWYVKYSWEDSVWHDANPGIELHTSGENAIKYAHTKPPSSAANAALDGAFPTT